MLDFLSVGFSKDLLKNSVSNLAIHAILSLCTSSDSSFLFRFSFSVGFLQRVSPKISFILPLLSDTGHSALLFSDTDPLLADVDSSDEDGDEVDESVVKASLF